MKPWKVLPYDAYDKEIEIDCGGISVFVDHDDVDIEVAENVASQIAQFGTTVDALNTIVTAAKAVIARWQSPNWEWYKQGPTGDLIKALGDAVAKAEALNG